MPAGYHREHPRLDLLRHKSMYASRGFGSPEWLQTTRAKTEILKTWRAMQPLIDWLDKYVGPSDKPVERRGT